MSSSSLLMFKADRGPTSEALQQVISTKYSPKGVELKCVSHFSDFYLYLVFGNFVLFCSHLRISVKLLNYIDTCGWNITKCSKCCRIQYVYGCKALNPHIFPWLRLCIWCCFGYLGHRSLTCPSSLNLHPVTSARTSPCGEQVRLLFVFVTGVATLRSALFLFLRCWCFSIGPYFLIMFTVKSELYLQVISTGLHSLKDYLFNMTLETFLG